MMRGSHTLVKDSVDVLQRAMLQEERKADA
jgi:hypothetical protein